MDQSKPAPLFKHADKCLRDASRPFLNHFRPSLARELDRRAAVIKRQDATLNELGFLLRQSMPIGHMPALATQYMDDGSHECAPHCVRCKFIAALEAIAKVRGAG